VSAPSAGARPRRVVGAKVITSVSVSASIHPGMTPPPRYQSSLYSQDSEHGGGRERVGVDLESVRIHALRGCESRRLMLTMSLLTGRD
jgi:hypothetical protein